SRAGTPPASYTRIGALVANIMRCAPTGRNAGMSTTMKTRATQIGAAFIASLALAIGLWAITSGEGVSASVPPRLSGLAALRSRPIVQAPYASRPSDALGCGPDWSVVPSPNVGASTNEFYGVAAVSSNDVWAVGYYGPGS